MNLYNRARQVREITLKGRSADPQQNKLVEAPFKLALCIIITVVW